MTVTQAVIQEEDIDPVDKYKHVAVVDCSKAFSTQEVSSGILTNF